MKTVNTKAVKFLAQFGLSATQVRKDKVAILCDVAKREVTTFLNRAQRSAKPVQANDYYLNLMEWNVPSWAARKTKFAVFTGALQLVGYLVFTKYNGCAEAHVELINA